MNDLKEGNGPFSDYGPGLFEKYWRNYGRYREDDPYTTLDEFFEWSDDLSAER